MICNQFHSKWRHPQTILGKYGSQRNHQASFIESKCTKNQNTSKTDGW